MRRTRILGPLPNDQRTRQLKDGRNAILSYLEELWKGRRETPETFDGNLQELNLDDDTYIRMLRYGLKSPKVFLQRAPDEIKINSYNKDILEMHRANMDIQYIVDPYSCVQYVLGYINKSSRGMSKLLREVVRETNAGSTSHKERLRQIGSKFLNATEISAQESAYYSLQMPVSKFSRQVVYINTAPPENRVRVVLSAKDLRQRQQQNPASTDIFKSNIIDYYVNRSDELEHLCLADVVANFDYTKTNGRQVAAPEPELSGEDTDNEDDYGLEEHQREIDEHQQPPPPPQQPHLHPQPGQHYPVANYGGYLKMRKEKVIRYRKYNEHQDPLNFCCEQVMLYLPYRNEVELRENCTALYEANLKLIKRNRAKYSPDDNERELDQAFEEAQRRQNEEDDADSEENEDIIIDDNEFNVLNPRASQEQPDFFEQVGMNQRERRPDVGAIELFRMPGLIEEPEYLDNITRLNRGQRLIFMECISRIKSGEPFHFFISGGAGVGKSFFINTLYQTATRYYNRPAGTNPASAKVLLCAFTGKAAFNIRGMTLHSAFSLPVTQFGGAMPELSHDVANSIRSNLIDTKLFIIDEVSMVGQKMFCKVDTRMKQIFGCNRPFGGRSVIVLGDMNQLSPIGDR